MFLILLFVALFPDVITSKPWNESVVPPDAVTKCQYDAAALGKVPNCAQFPPSGRTSRWAPPSSTTTSSASWSTPPA